MEVAAAAADVRAACDRARRDSRSVGFVPTMGALHEGHLSLVRRAREETGFVVASIFVNPLQFGPSEDLAAYPRDLDRDLGLLGEEKADLVFTPPPEELYPSGEPQVTVDPGPVGDRLEGASRPGHFRGVCTVVAKLLSIVGPCQAFFGEKDAQQLWVVRRMATDLDLPVEVTSCETVREPDGLAMSSRNAYLSPEERAAATCLHRALLRAVELTVKGEREAAVLRREMAWVIKAEPLADLVYATVVEEGSFEEVDEAPDPAARALVAARVGSTRLIDNMLLPPSMQENA